MTDAIRAIRTRLGPAARGVFDDVYILMVNNNPIGYLPYDARELAKLLKIRTHQAHLALAAMIKTRLIKRKQYGLYCSPLIIREVYSQAFTKPASQKPVEMIRIRKEDNEIKK